MQRHVAGASIAVASASAALWGDTGQGLLGWWSFGHVAFWIIVALNVSNMPWMRGRTVLRWALYLAGAVVWELIEPLGERYAPHVWLADETLLNKVGDVVITMPVGAGIGEWLRHRAHLTSPRAQG